MLLFSLHVIILVICLVNLRFKINIHNKKNRVRFYSNVSHQCPRNRKHKMWWSENSDSALKHSYAWFAFKFIWFFREKKISTKTTAIQFSKRCAQGYQDIKIDGIENFNENNVPKRIQEIAEWWGSGNCTCFMATTGQYSTHTLSRKYNVVSENSLVYYKTPGISTQLNKIDYLIKIIKWKSVTHFRANSSTVFVLARNEKKTQ